MALKVTLQVIRTELLKHRLEAVHLFRNHKQIPDLPPINLSEGISTGLFTSPVEANDAAFGVKHNHQSPYRMQNGGDDVALLLQCLFCPLQIGNIKTHAVNEPGLAILLSDHLGFAMKPDDPAIA